MNMQKPNYFSKEEILKIYEMASEGNTCGQMADILKRPASSIYGVVRNFRILGARFPNPTSSLVLIKQVLKEKELQ